MFQETETLKNFLYSRNQLFKLEKIKNIHLEKISYTSGNGSTEKISYAFLKESFSYISGNGNPKKIL